MSGADDFDASSDGEDVAGPRAIAIVDTRLLSRTPPTPGALFEADAAAATAADAARRMRCGGQSDI